MWKVWHTWWRHRWMENVRGSARPRKLWTWWRQRQIWNTSTQTVWQAQFVKAQMNAECARIRTSQETMNLVTTVKDMKFELEQYDRVCEGTDECSMCSRHGREHWQRQRFGHWQAADAHFIICRGVEVPHLVNFVMAQRHRTPACIQRSWPMCQYSYWADLNCARKLAEPTLALNFKHSHTWSTIVVPDFTTAVFRVLGQAGLTSRT